MEGTPVHADMLMQVITGELFMAQESFNKPTPGRFNPSQIVVGSVDYTVSGNTFHRVFNEAKDGKLEVSPGRFDGIVLPKQDFVIVAPSAKALKKACDEHGVEYKEVRNRSGAASPVDSAAMETLRNEFASMSEEARVRGEEMEKKFMKEFAMQADKSEEQLKVLREQLEVSKKQLDEQQKQTKQTRTSRAPQQEIATLSQP